MPKLSSKTIAALASGDYVPFLQVQGDGTFIIRRYAATLDNLAATAAPTAGDDSGDGYAVGSRWLDTTNDRAYVCLDATAASAVWLETTVDRTAAAQADSTATDVAGIVADFNALLAKLRTAGLLAT